MSKTNIKEQLLEKKLMNILRQVRTPAERASTAMLDITENIAHIPILNEAISHFLKINEANDYELDTAFLELAAYLNSLQEINLQELVLAPKAKSELKFEDMNEYTNSMINAIADLKKVCEKINKDISDLI